MPCLLLLRHTTLAVSIRAIDIAGYFRCRYAIRFSLVVIRRFFHDDADAATLFSADASMMLLY